jgi:general secretion pathway protein G
MHRNVRIHTPRGFTLIELLLVLVILAVLAAVVVPKFTARSEQARTTAAKTDISSMETALDAFEVDCGRYPSTEEGLRALVEAPGNVQNWRGAYLKRGVPNDPWGNAYVYRFPGSGAANSYDLYSMGPDGREGGDDITNFAPGQGQ